MPGTAHQRRTFKTEISLECLVRMPDIDKLLSHRVQFPNNQQHRLYPSESANVTNHRPDKRRLSCRLQWSVELLVPTCTCYPYAVKFISRVSATDHHGSYLRFHTWPCLYAPNSRDSWNKTGRNREWTDGNEDRVPHLRAVDFTGRFARVKRPMI